MSDLLLPEYSVLMCVYKNDKAEYLALAVSSMLSQTVKPHDIVIVCDGELTPSLDETLDRLIAHQDTNITVVRLNENHGLGYALNYGLPKCQCDIVARMDSDDLSRPDRCERLLSKMTKENLDLVGGAIEEFNHEPGDMGAVRMPPLTREEIMKWLKRRNPFNHVSVIFNRKAVQLAGGYEPFAWMEDYWLWVRMIANNCKCANISDVVVDVRTGEGMYARRSNVTYLKSQIHFFSELQKLELINSRERAMAISERTIATLLPTGLVKVAYNKFLREKKGH